MTLEIQKKGHLQVSNDDIKQALVKKENGVNPFLTVMNFRITFRAWSKQARRRILHAERAKALRDGDEPASALIEEEAKASVVAVEIDVENIYSATSEEDDGPEIGDGRNPMSRSRSGAGLAVSMSGSVHGSNSDRASGRNLRRSLKQKDHLAHFQKKMTVKFQEALVSQRMSSGKKSQGIDLEGREGRHLRASILRSMTKRQRALNDLNQSSVKLTKSML